MKKYQSFLDECFDGKQVFLQKIFKGSEHDFKANAFHSYCDNKGPTLSVILSDTNRLFGGFTSKNWTSSFQKDSRE